MKKMLFAFSMAGLFLLSACSRPAAEETETAGTTAGGEHPGDQRCPGDRGCWGR